jgi:hypothetical protein
VRTYSIEDGSTLVVSVDGGDWQTVTFAGADFADLAAARADEVAAVLERIDGVDAGLDDAGNVVMESELAAGNASLDVDLVESSAAAALGLARGSDHAVGRGIEAPRLVSQEIEPFDLPAGAQMAIVRNGQLRRIEFKKDFTEGAATAAEVVRLVNAKHRGLATRTPDGRVALMIRDVGPDLSIEVRGPDDPSKPDAAAALGFTGPAAASRPVATEAPRLVLGAQTATVAAVSLSSAPIELHSATGVTRLTSGEAIPLTPLEAADPQLQRLVGQGEVRLVAGQTPAAASEATEEGASA